MGCICVKSTRTTETVVTPTLRKRLSLGDLGEEESASIDPETPAEEDERSTLLQLSRQQVLLLAQAKSAPIGVVKAPVQEEQKDEKGSVRRSFTVGSITDADMHRVESFVQKTIKAYGEPVTAQDGLGYACKKGLKPESPNQDSFFILKVDGLCSIYGVFDGHGRKGHDISNFIKDNLPKILLQQECLEEDPLAALSDTFEQTQSLIVEATRLKVIDATQSGSTVSVIYHDHRKNMIHVAHVGDSRCVLGKCHESMQGSKWTSIDLTVDHKPNDPVERSRIEAAGGRVVFDGGWNYRVYASTHRGPGLNMSRAMGDLRGFWYAGISASPDVKSIQVRGGESPERRAAHKLASPEGSPSGKPKTFLDQIATPAAEEHSKSDAGYISAGERGGFETANSQQTLSQASGLLSSSASLSSYSVSPADKFVLLCSDGIWEFISSEEAVRLVAPYSAKEAMEAADHLTSIAWERWVKEMSGQVVDDITCVLVNLQA